MTQPIVRVEIEQSFEIGIWDTELNEWALLCRTPGMAQLAMREIKKVYGSGRFTIHPMDPAFTLIRRKKNDEARAGGEAGEDIEREDLQEPQVPEEDREIS